MRGNNGERAGSGDGEQPWAASARLRADIEALLRCPSCGSRLRVAGVLAHCTNSACAASFRHAPSGAWDLRLTRPKVVHRTNSIGATSPSKANIPFCASNPVPEVDWRSFRWPVELRRRLQGYLPRAAIQGTPMLDVGCGTATCAPVFRHCGFEYVGMDIHGDSAGVLADAMALPFADNSFGLVWSNAVLQYVAYPDVALSEIFRVLQPGAAFVGSIGLIEAFDGDNMHLTTWRGARQLFVDAGFVVKHIEPNDRWTGALAISRSLFPGLPLSLMSALVRPLEAASKLYWWLGHLFRPGIDPSSRLIKVTGGLDFILRKPER